MLKSRRKGGGGWEEKGEYVCTATEKPKQTRMMDEWLVVGHTAQELLVLSCKRNSPDNHGNQNEGTVVRAALFRYLKNNKRPETRETKKSRHSTPEEILS